MQNFPFPRVRTGSQSKLHNSFFNHQFLQQNLQQSQLRFNLTSQTHTPLLFSFFFFFKHMSGSTPQSAVDDAAVNTGLVGLILPTISTVNTKYRRSTFCLTSLLLLRCCAYFYSLLLFTFCGG